ncbi:escrt-i component [Ophiostoma piceae UAMH 11346]|uniref:Escrt-i component n=1 Tax=Ophiostoma piceae (strain UAMH 11346) TaxID=1262450 RepID=S3D415_OPHP1|nr:escrt-i component [Ophiostoma piceae UAMH 11346]
MAVQQHVLNWLYSVLTSEYQDVNRTYNDVSQALSHFPSLSPRTDVHTFPNGASALLLHLSGTLPAVFRGATYRYPISLWVPHNYPREAPLVYVTPTENMMVRPGQHVDPQGQVYHPYLAGWPEFWDKSSIVDFLTILREVFAKEPPVISRQTPRPPPPPPSQQAQQAPQELATPTHQIPQPVQPATPTLARPGSVAASTPSPQPPPPPPKGQLRAGIPPAHNTPSPPPVPPHPSYGSSGTAYGSPAAAAGPSPPPPPPPPHPSASASAATGGVRSSWYGASPPPPQAVEAGPSSRNTEHQARPGVPPVPGRPPYQQSPLGQPPMSPNQQHAQLQHQQHQIPPFPPQPSSSTSPPPPSQYPPGFAAAQQFQYSQQQPPQGYPQQRSPPPPWPQQQPPPQFQQFQQQQQQQYGQYALQQQQPRPRQPPPDIMDEPLSDGAAGSGGASATSHTAARGPSATDGAPQPPPVPPNPEKDALLHQLAHTLAVMRQESRSKNESTLAGLQAQRAAMVTAANRLQQEMSGVAQLSALLTSNTDILHESMAAADGVVANSQQTRPPAIDELLVGPTVVANQLYELVAEERALADAVFMLGRAVERGRVTPVVFAKMTRSLAREWYLKKALVRKVGRGMGLAQA